MKPNIQTQDAFRRVANTPEGRVVGDYIKSLYEMDIEALVMSEQPEQTRRLQGMARRTKAIIGLFELNKAP